MRIRHMVGFSIVLFTVLLFTLGHAWAVDVEVLTRQVGKNIRQAENLMFSGKNEEADALLKTVSLQLEEIRTAQPDHKALKGLQSKYDRTRKQIDKKLNKNTGFSTSRPEVAAPVTAEPPKHTGSSAYGSYKKQMQDRDMKKVVKDVAYELNRARQELEPEGNIALPRSAEQKAKAALGFVERAQGHVGKIKSKYPDASEDSGLRSAVSDIETVRQEIAKWKQSQQQLEQQAAAAAAVAEADKAAAMDVYAKNAEQMLALYDRYYASFEKIHGGTLIYGMNMEQVEAAIALVEQAEKTIPEFSGELGHLADTYGTTSGDIYNHFHAKGFTLKHGEEIKMERMLQAVENVGKSRKASADTLAEYASALLGAFDQQLNDTRIKRMEQAKQFLLAGQRMDGGNKKVRTMLAQIDDQMADVAEKMEAQINAATWKDNIRNFPGPGKVKSLAAEAKRYFENDRDWGKKPGKQVEILAVSVRGPWKVAETDMFGRVIQWRLPIHVAVTDEKLRPRNIARVYDLSIVALEGAPGKALKAPPFDGYWVGDSWMMRLDKF